MGRSELVGRRHEVDRLRSAVAEAADGRGRFVLVEGEAGIGKTRLTSEVAKMAVERGFAFLVGRGERLERARPFGPFTRALGLSGTGPPPDDPLRRQLIDLLRPREARHDQTVSLTPDTQFRIVDSIIEVIQRAALSKPIAIVLDDLQWADTGTHRAVATLTRSVDDLPVLLVAARRTGTAGDDHEDRWAALAARADHHMVLEGLDRESVEDLVTRTLGHRPGPHLLTELDRATGNPFFVLELVGLITERGLLGAVDGEVDLTDPLPAELTGFALFGIGDLPASTRELLRVASVLGRSMKATTVADVMGTTTTAIAGDVSTAIEARVLTASGIELTFRHDLVRDALYAGIAESVRIGMHRDVARVMLETGAPIAEIAPHAAIGASTGDDDAIAVMLQAARDVATTAPAIAADWLEHAIRLLPADDDRRARATADLSQAYVWSGQTQAAERIARSELERSNPPEREYRLRTTLAAVLFLQGRLRDAAEEFETLAGRAEGSGPERGVAYDDAALSRLLSADFDRAASLVDTALELPDGGVETQAYAHGVRALLEGLSGRISDAVEAARRGVVIADGAPEREGHRNLPHFFLAQIQLWADDLDGAVETVRTGRRVAADLGVGWDVPIYHVVTAGAALRRGDWDDAVAEAEAGLGYADDLNVHLEDAIMLSVLAEIHVGRDELEEAEAALDRADDAQQRSGGHGADHVLRAQALLLEARGELDQGAGSLGLLWDQMISLRVPLRLVEYGPDLIRMLVASDRHGRAETVLAQLDGARVDGTARADASRAWCRGLVHGEAEHLKRAEALVESIGAAVDLAVVRAELAGLWSKAGEADRARRTRSTAVDTLRSVDAVGLLRRHRLDANAPPAGRPDRWDQLTRSERRVVNLVAEGLSNRDIAERLSVSRRTVESHLYHVYPKLDITSRVELAVQAAAALDPDLY